MRAHTIRAVLIGSASCLSLVASMAAAQEADEPVADDEFLGTIELGESKREVQTETATPVTNIDQEEINDRQAGTVAELIDSVPGVTLVNGSTPQGSGINIRGFGANGTFGTDQKVLVLVDGATTGAEELYRIGNQLFTDPQLYKSVSVIRGTVGSFEFGSGVIGGVVRLETKDASDFTGGEVGFRFRQTLEAATNGRGFVTSSIAAWQPTEDLELLLNYTYRTQDNQKDGDGNIIGNSEFKLPSYLVKGKYTFGNDRAHSVTLSYNDSNSSEKDVPYDSFGTTGGAFGNVDRDIHNRVVGVRYQYSPVANDLIDLDVNLTYSDQEINSQGTDRTVSPFLLALVDADHRYETTKLTVKNSAFFTTGQASHDLRAGFELIRRERLDASSAPGGTDDRWALFLVDDIAVTDQFTLSPALRYESQKIDANAPGLSNPALRNASYDNDALMGGLSARYEFQSGFAVFGSAAYTESLPIIDDLGNPTFMTQPERAATYEAGASYNKNDVFSSGDTVRAKVNFYDTRVWDITSYSRVSKVELQGIEVEGSYAHASGFYADVNMNAVRGDEYFTAAGTTTAIARDWRNLPQDTVRVTLGKRFGPAWDVSWEGIFARSSEQRTFTGVQNVPGFGVNNLRVTYRPQNGVLEGAEIRAGIENIFDKTYQPKLSTRPAVGRNFKLTLAKTF